VGANDHRLNQKNHYSSASDLRRHIAELIKNDKLNRTGYKPNQIAVVIRDKETIETPGPIDPKEPKGVEENDGPRVDSEPKIIPKKIKPNLKYEGGSIISWNPEIQEADIILVYTFSWSELKDSPLQKERIERRIRIGSDDYKKGRHKFAPKNSIEKKMHQTDVTVTLQTVLSKKTITSDIKAPNFDCK
jgi:hypothetical protein